MVSLPLPGEGQYMVYYRSHGAWAGVPVDREFLMTAEDPGPTIVEILDNKIKSLREEEVNATT